MMTKLLNNSLLGLFYFILSLILILESRGDARVSAWWFSVDTCSKIISCMSSTVFLWDQFGWKDY